MFLNSASDMPRFSSVYCGICWYFANSAAHALSPMGGMTPDTGCHSVIESPLSVRRTAPPIGMSNAIIKAHSASHRPTAREPSFVIMEFRRTG